MKTLNVWFSVLFLMMSCIFYGCAQPPDAEKQSALNSMNTAISQKADKYCANDFSNARRLLREADNKMKAKTYTEAKKFYIDAKAAFETAIANIENGKKTLSEENIKLQADMEKKWTDLKKAAAKNAKKMAKEIKSEWNSASKDVEGKFNSVKSLIQSDPLTAKVKLIEIRNQVNSWEFKLSNMSKPSASPAKKKAKK